MSKGRQLLLLSSSTIHGTEYLQYAAEEIKTFLNGSNVERVLFVPYALRDHAGYTDKVRSALAPMGFKVDGIDAEADPVKAVEAAQAVFVGGGNTFRLLSTLYELSLLEPIRHRTLAGMPYIGSSAGTNVATASIATTNDMPIIYPPSFVALGLVPFNINPHYIDADPNSTHLGETREERIAQFHEIADTPPVLGLREGSMLLVDGANAALRGNKPARLFRPNEKAEEFPAGADLSFLLR